MYDVVDVVAAQLGQTDDGDERGEDGAFMTMDRKTMIGELGADGPNPTTAGPLDLFGQFVGAWELEWRGKDSAGTLVSVRGDLYVSWVLDGRAVQDIWRVPLDPLDAGLMRAFHGTTIRFYDPGIKAWRSTRLDPLNGRVRRSIGRSTGDSIVLDGLDEDPQERWSFRDITPNSFTWRGEESIDGGQTWVLNDEMYATRMQP